MSVLFSPMRNRAFFMLSLIFKASFRPEDDYNKKEGKKSQAFDLSINL